MRSETGLSLVVNVLIETIVLEVVEVITAKVRAAIV